GPYVFLESRSRLNHGSLHFVQRVLGSADIYRRSLQEGMLWASAWISRYRRHLYCRARHLVSDSESPPHECRKEWPRLAEDGKVFSEPAASVADWRFPFAYGLGRFEGRRQLELAARHRHDSRKCLRHHCGQR